MAFRRDATLRNGETNPRAELLVLGAHLVTAICATQPRVLQRALNRKLLSIGGACGLSKARQGRAGTTGHRARSQARRGRWKPGRDGQLQGVGACMPKTLIQHAWMLASRSPPQYPVPVPLQRTQRALDPHSDRYRTVGTHTHPDTCLCEGNIFSSTRYRNVRNKRISCLPPVVPPPTRTVVYFFLLSYCTRYEVLPPSSNHRRA